MLLEWLTHTAAREYVVRSVLHIHAVVHRVLADLVVGPRQHVQSARTVAPARNVVPPRFNQAERGGVGLAGLRVVGSKQTHRGQRRFD